MANKLNFYNDGYDRVFRVDGATDIDWSDATNITAVLLTGDYTPDAGHSTYENLTNEVQDEDYDPQAVTGREITRESDDIRHKSDKVLFGEDVSITARYLVLVAGDPADLNNSDPLIGYVDFGEEKSSTNAEFSWNPADEGWWRVQKNTT